MSVLDSKQSRASWLVLLLGLALVVALWPYASGLLGAPVLYSITAPLHRWLARRMPRGVAAILVILLLVLLVAGPGTWLVTILVGQAQSAAQQIAGSPLLDRLTGLTIGPIDVGAQVAEAGKSLVSWLGQSAIGLVGTATRFVLNLTLSFFGLYFLLVGPDTAWGAVRPFIPFSDASADLLRERFHAVTTSTVIGTGVTALMQGTLVAIAFAVTGLGNAVFWGVVTAVFAILPVVGSGLVWGPAAITLFTRGETGWALAMLAWGGAVVGSVDNLIRPIVYNRYARIHPMVTLVGAIAGVSYMGLLGLLLGPLAISYFFELIRLYRAEYGSQAMESWFMPPAAPVPPGAAGGSASGAATGDEVEGNPS
jgi:predicted PurR-regulated permease PerM